MRVNIAVGVLRAFYYAKRPTPSWRTCDGIGNHSRPILLLMPRGTSSLPERSKLSQSLRQSRERVGPAKRCGCVLKDRAWTVATRHPINSISTALLRLDPHLGRILAVALVRRSLLRTFESFLTLFFLPSFTNMLLPSTHVPSLHFLPTLR